jgi:pyruvate/2-oxoglutarate dehydrogenase complex dihydrolipoamide acyltransferase (E2) component
MRASKDKASHFTYVEEVDATELVNLRSSAKEIADRRGIPLTFLPFIVKATVAGLKAHPLVNSRLDEEAGVVRVLDEYHIGIAVATEHGLIVPVVKNADKKSVFQISQEIQDLSEKTRNGKASREELTGSTFTITSLGKMGGLLATPIINQPEVAIMGVHAIKDRGVVRDGKVVPGKVMNLSFSFDHGIVDGAYGAEFAQTVIRYLEDPKLLLLETA